MGEEVGGGYGAGYGGEVVDRFAEVLGYKVGGDVGRECVDGTLCGFGGCVQGLIVAGVGDGDLGGGVVEVGYGCECVGERRDVGVGESR